jgi:hypothetical protein
MNPHRRTFTPEERSAQARARAEEMTPEERERQTSAGRKARRERLARERAAFIIIDDPFYQGRDE